MTAAQVEITARQVTEDEASDASIRIDFSDDGTRLLGLVVALGLVAGFGALFRWWLHRGGAERPRAAAPRPAGGVGRLVDSPIRVLRWRAAGSPRAGLALLPVLLHATAGSVVGLAAAGMPLQAGAVVLVALYSVAGLASFALHAGAVVMIAALAASEAGHARKLVELAALTYWTQVGWSVPAAVVLSAAGPPPGGDPGTVGALVEVTGQLWGVWLLGLHAAALHVVAGFTVAGTWAAGLVLCALFYGLPRLGGVLLGGIF